MSAIYYCFILYRFNCTETINDELTNNMLCKNIEINYAPVYYH